ncbi:hypothetical protein GCM10017673_51480 [Streptosporangium violaceochromogenes]|nr:hypothetical protein GCM10017673_51480 [Streptosporangium violaceochromogenes]
MTGKKELAMAVAAGYLLGRRHKLRLALTLALAGATGRLGAARGNLLGQATKVLGSSPELEKIAESVRSGLLEAGKAAAVTAASRQINALSSRLSERATAPLGGVGLDEEESEESEEEEEEPQEAAEKPRRRTAASRKEPQGRVGKQTPATRRPTAKKETATGARKKTSAADEEPEDEKPRKKPAKSRGAATREGTSSSERPVRRVRG